MELIRFQKLQGLGNDFILFDAGELDSIGREKLDIPSLCDRRLGIGADGVLIYQVARTGVEVSMVYFNADGSRAETCFNGLRCIALWAVLNGDVQRGKPFVIQSDAGPVAAAVMLESDEAVVELAGGVSRRNLIRGAVEPVDGCEWDLNFDFGSLKGIPMSIGNPHFIVWRTQGDITALNDEVATIGARVEKARYFPDGTNFELAVKVDDQWIRMAVWERGVGLTKACGSGAAAAVCSGVLSGRLAADTPIDVEMAGGRLSIEALSASGRIKVQGPAAHVFSGKFEVGLFTRSLAAS